jgi:hypothetical protein
MSAHRLWAAAAVIALFGPAAVAGQYTVYYRASMSSPWQFYAAGLTAEQANADAAELRSVGYLADAVAGGGYPAAPASAYASATATSGGSGAFTSYVGPSYWWWNGGGGGGAHWSDHWDWQHHDWQHHDWHHTHVGPGPHPPHPTPHPHHHPHPHPHPHPVHHQHAHHHAHHAAHHAAHHHAAHHRR